MAAFYAATMKMVCALPIGERAAMFRTLREIREIQEA